METFIPNAPVPLVPIPFGQLTVALAESLKPSHPITITNPILLSDFPDTPQGAVAYTALQRVSEILSHGFLTPSNTPLDDSAPHRELWLSTVSQILVHIYNSIRRTHNANPLPNAFKDLSTDELESFKLLSTTVSSLSSFFDNRFKTLITDPDKPDTEAWEICLRCLEECQYPITKADYETVLMSCAQNIHAAHRTIINDKLCSLTHEMDEWVDVRCTQIQLAFIDAVISDDLSSLHDATDRDPRLAAWSTATLASFTDTAKRFMAQEAVATTAEPLLIEALQAAKVRVDTEGEAYLSNYICDERTKAEAAAKCDALLFYNDTLRALKAEATERSEREIAEFKSTLKVKNEELKAVLLDDFDKRAPKPSLTSSSVARSSRHKTCVDRSNSVAGPSPGPLKSHSVSRSRSLAPSPDSLVPGRSPDQMTPRALPVVDLPPTRPNTEPPALTIRPPPMDVSVGPPSNSFETAMMHVDMSTLTAFEYPCAPSAFEPQGPPNTQLAGSISSSSLDPPTSSIESLIRGMSESFLAKLQETSFAAQSQFSALSQHLQALEQPAKAYSPSAAAASWRPPCPLPQDAPPGSSDHVDITGDIPTWFYRDPHMEDSDEPDWPDSYLRSLYFSRLSLPPSHTPTDIQQDYILTLPGLFFCRHFHLSPDHHLSEFDIFPFWNFVNDYKRFEATGRDPLTIVSDGICSGLPKFPDLPERPFPHPLNPTSNAPLNSIKLFPGRAPSQPPIATINQPPPPPPQPALAPPPNAPWNVMGKGNKPHSFAAAAAPWHTAPVVVSPIQTAPQPSNLTDSQLQSMSRDQLLRAYETRFRLSVTS